MEQVIKLIVQVISLIVSAVSKRDKKKGEHSKEIREQAVTKVGTKVPGQKERYLAVEQRKPVLEQVAEDLGVELNLIKAFIQVESGKYHKLNGKLVINYESHYFKRLSGVYVADKNIIRGDKLNQEDEWRNFSEAKAKNPEAAFKSISMGKTQIMGANYKILGYASAKEMYGAFAATEDNAFYGFGAFVKANSRLHNACKTKNYHLMAYYYNGSKYKEYVDSSGKTYADKIKEAYVALCI